MAHQKTTWSFLLGCAMRSKSREVESLFRIIGQSYWAWGPYHRNSHSLNDNVTSWMIMGEYSKRATKMVKFFIMNLLSTYSGILNRPSQNDFRDMPSTKHHMVKFLTEQGIEQDRSNRQTSKMMYFTIMKNKAATAWLTLSKSLGCLGIPIAMEKHN